METALVGLGLLAAIGLMIWGVFRLSKRALANMQMACAESTRVFGIAPVALSPAEAAEHFGLHAREVFEPIAAWSGQVHGITVSLGAFAHESNTMVNGALIPIVTTHVIAALPRPLSCGLYVGRRVAMMDRSKVILGTHADRLLVINAEDSKSATEVLSSSPELVDEIVTFILAGQGSAFVYPDHLVFMVFRPDASRINEAVRNIVRLTKSIDSVFFD